MRTFIRDRSLSATTVVFVLLITMLLEGGISFTLMFGKLTEQVPSPLTDRLQAAISTVTIVVVAGAAINNL
jgi:hypothetical protein